MRSAVVDGYTNNGEATPLVSVLRSSRLAMRYGRSRKCVSSKAALLILLWSFVVGLLSGMFINPDFYLAIVVDPIALVAYGCAVIFTCFFPLAGFCADIGCGRYKTVVASLCIVLVSTPVLPVVVWLNLTLLEIAVIVLLLVCIIFTNVGLVGFTANVVQFGMDQLHDSPGEDRTLFIHWYVWTYYVSIFINQLAWNMIIIIPYNYNYLVINTLYGVSIVINTFHGVSIAGFCLLALILLLVISPSHNLGFDSM